MLLNGKSQYIHNIRSTLLKDTIIHISIGHDHETNVQDPFQILSGI